MRIGNQQIPPWLVLERSRRRRRGNYRGCHRHGFQQLVLDADAIADGQDGNGGLGHVRTQIGHGAGDIDARIGRQRQ